MKIIVFCTQKGCNHLITSFDSKLSYLLSRLRTILSRERIPHSLEVKDDDYYYSFPKKKDYTDVVIYLDYLCSPSLFDFLDDCEVSEV